MIWLPMKTPDGYRVARVNGGAVEYERDADGFYVLYTNRQAVRRRCERLNINRLPKAMEPAELDQALAGLSVSPGMRQALTRLLIHADTWKQSAKAGAVTESGLLRAMRRMMSAQMQKRQN